MTTAPGNASERAQNLGSSPAPSRRRYDMTNRWANRHLPSEIRGLPLTPREFDCLRRAAHGLTDQAIAIDMGLGKQTVKNHMTVVLRKLGAQGRIEAFVVMGWLKPPAIEVAA